MKKVLFFVVGLAGALLVISFVCLFYSIIYDAVMSSGLPNWLKFMILSR